MQKLSETLGGEINSLIVGLGVALHVRQLQKGLEQRGHHLGKGIEKGGHGIETFGQQISFPTC